MPWGCLDLRRVATDVVLNSILGIAILEAFEHCNQCPGAIERIIATAGQQLNPLFPHGLCVSNSKRAAKTRH
jgi:hypothetical protein